MTEREKIIDLEHARRTASRPQICETVSVERMLLEVNAARTLAENPRRTATLNVGIFGPAGCGKTTFLLDYAARNPATIYFEARDAGGDKANNLTRALVEAVNEHALGRAKAWYEPFAAPRHGWPRDHEILTGWIAHEVRGLKVKDLMDLNGNMVPCPETRLDHLLDFAPLFEGAAIKPQDVTRLPRALSRFFKETGTVLLVDEMQMLKDMQFEVLRGIADRSGIPMVFAGNETLYERITPGSGQKRKPSGQFTSRFSARVGITAEDMAADAVQFAKWRGVKEKAALDWVAETARFEGLRVIATLLDRLELHSAKPSLEELKEEYEVAFR